MKIEKQHIDMIDFKVLQIFDYTAGLGCSSSIAEITVPVKGRHPRAFSKKSDKFYYVVSGKNCFCVEDEMYDLEWGDVCVIKREPQRLYSISIFS